MAILFFQRVLHAGASAQTIAGLATGIPVFIIGIALGVPLSRWLTPMQLAIGAPLLGAVLAGVQYFDTHLWQAVVLSYIGAPFIGAYIIVMAPLLLQLLPRAGGLGERLGVLLSPFNLVSVVLAYVAAAVVDATGQLPPDLALPGGHRAWATPLVNCWLKYPERKNTSPDMVKRLWEWAIVQAESMSETGIVTGLLAAPLLGVVTEEDADSAVVVDMARNILGNPYEDRTATGDAGRRARPVSDPVTTVGRGLPRGDRRGPGRRRPGRRRENGDQKFGMGRRVVVDSRTGAPLPVPDLTAGVPDTGVGSPDDRVRDVGDRRHGDVGDRLGHGDVGQRFRGGRPVIGSGSGVRDGVRFDGRPVPVPRAGAGAGRRRSRPARAGCGANGDAGSRSRPMHGRRADRDRRGPYRAPGAPEDADGTVGRPGHLGAASTTPPTGPTRPADGKRAGRSAPRGGPGGRHRCARPPRCRRRWRGNRR